MVKRNLTLKIKPPGAESNIIEYLEETIHQIFNYIKENISDDMKVGIVFNSSSFEHGAGILSYRYLRDINVDNIWDLIFKITQSRSKFTINETFPIKISTIEMPFGTGRQKKAAINRTKMRSVI